MTNTATSPRYHSHSQARSQQQRPSTTPSNPPAMTPFLSPRRSSPQRKAPQTPSPNYFGFQAEGASLLTDSPQHAKGNWSPPSSTVRSTAAVSPSVVPLEQNPDFDAFRKQSQEGKAFNLAGLNSFKMSMPSPRPGGARLNGHQASNSHPQTSPAKSTPVAPKDIQIPAAHRSGLQEASPTELARSPKRVLSPGSQYDSNRRGSPPEYDSDRERMTSSPPEMHPRVQLPLDTLNGGYPSSVKHRAETLPATTNDPESQSMATPQHIVNLLNSKTDEILLLDLRVATQYATSHAVGALNLCIPTTLLKRPSFNVQKLAETFKDDEQRGRFENWRNASYIIVYDGNSATLKDATICSNTIKKFRSEGFEGALYIVKGGFLEFSKRFPSYVEQGMDGSSAATDGDGPEVAPVVGGCPMPSTDKPANPFFGNIRQNMDLIGGVGQMAIKHPSKETKAAEQEYPEWLKAVADEKDQGKKVSNRFEQIERREKKRMEDALSGKVSFGTPTKEPAHGEVQIAGLEKGNKNRYNNIWPFEHSRVRLQGVPSHGCDYFNASHIKASWSNKRYISTQAPIPATFNDFWNVVWQQDVRVVVMLTAEKEGAQVKAHNYWDKRQYGSIQLDFLSEKRASLEPSRIHQSQKRPSPVRRASTKSQNPQVPLAPVDSKEEKGSGSDQPFVIVRKFTIKHDKHPFAPMRELTQLQYSSWPDFGAPAHPAHLLGLVEQCDAVVRASNRSHSSEQPEPEDARPVLVHCSAGCGRTGTFCTVDSVIDMLKRQRMTRSNAPPRQGTPMDVDKDSKRSSAGRSRSDGGFFASEVQHDSDGVDGAWLHRDDQDLVEKTVSDFRHQRLSMVQCLRQYVLCYESVMEWLVEQGRAAKGA
ncbi:related to tyrosine- phosphatase non-receptor type 12 [Lecanosticta acicola]|uniref:protein-tyrosine-phosphatase n=1 Tax=Lecanosticta acicola TaxID=111012 RepID=A0AAI8YSK6_9PEZI|nr:related to tyrosine- phosphatase non-receptor type 12 [Lecanosticta acicola]